MKDFQINYTLHLADDALIMAQRLSEWTGHGPALEADIAVSNIALDYLGQCRNLYQYAASLINMHDLQDSYPSGSAGDIDEDDLAYLRTEREYKNHLLAEQPNGDWAQTMLKIFLFSAWQKQLYTQLRHGADVQLSAIAEKSLKEVTYHQRWSADWVVRLGDGTEESHARMHKAIDEVWMFTGELFLQPSYALADIDYTLLRSEWLKIITSVMGKARLGNHFTEGWENAPAFQKGGPEGLHTEHLGYILAEMQYLQRTYPGSEW